MKLFTFYCFRGGKYIISLCLIQMQRTTLLDDRVHKGIFPDDYCYLPSPFSVSCFYENNNVVCWASHNLFQEMADTKRRQLYYTYIWSVEKVQSAISCFPKILYHVQLKPKSTKWFYLEQRFLPAKCNSLRKHLRIKFRYVQKIKYGWLCGV